MLYDVIILGAGTMGLSAGYQLAKKGQKVLMVDSYHPPMSTAATMAKPGSFVMHMEKGKHMYHLRSVPKNCGRIWRGKLGEQSWWRQEY